MAFAILLQSPPLAFADDLSEGVTDATQTDVPVVVPSPAPPTTDISPAPVAPVESVAGGGAATGSIAVAPPASSAGTGKYYLGLWRKSGNRWWFSYPCGCFAKGWKEIGGTWYFFDTRDWMKTGWQKIGTHWYYLEKSGAMKIGWHKSGGSWYYLKPSGAMAASTWIDDYYVDAGGAWVPNKTK